MSWRKLIPMIVIPGRGQSPQARNPGTPACQSYVKAGVHGFRAWPIGPSRNDDHLGKRTDVGSKGFPDAAYPGGFMATSSMTLGRISRMTPRKVASSAAVAA